MDPDCPPPAEDPLLASARDVLRTEASVLIRSAAVLGSSFSEAVRVIHRCPGTVICTGVGKAGLIARKVSASLCSLGTVSRFLHPTEAAHGDLGCLRTEDVVIAFSNSGESAELLQLLPPLQSLGCTLIAVSRDKTNTLARACSVAIAYGHHEEAGALRLAPTSSTVAMLGVGDALALVVAQQAEFSESDFAVRHPAGSLGLKLRQVREIMRVGSQLRIASETETIREVMVRHRVPGRRTGAVMLVDQKGRLTGVFTDSDLARLLEERREQELDSPIHPVMTRNPLTIAANCRLPEAIRLVSDRKLSEVPVIDDAGIPVGLLDITDLIGLAGTASLLEQPRGPVPSSHQDKPALRAA